MFQMGAETMALPSEEKLKFEQGDEGMSHGCVPILAEIIREDLCKYRYKAAGANATDASGVKDTVEFINIAQDDVLAYPNFVHRTYPSTVNVRMESTIIPFVKKSAAVNDTVMSIFNAKLGLPEGMLASFHRREKPSGSEARCIKNPPKPEQSAQDLKVAIGSHTDFGSLVQHLYFLNRTLLNSWFTVVLA